MLKTRILTAAILIPLVLLGVFKAPPHLFMAIVIAVVGLCAFEMARLLSLNTVLRVVFIAVAMALSFLCHPYPLISSCYAVIFWGLATYWVIQFREGKPLWPHHPVMSMIIGLSVLVPMGVGLINIRGFIYGQWWLLTLFLFVWGADTAAYFGGKRWGRRRLAKEVSPGKTWEGFITALLMGAALGCILGLLKAQSLGMILAFILLGIVTVAFSVVGDLFESLLKREVGLKDSGTMIPGHGGICDRLDSLMAAAPLFFLGVSLMS